MLHFTIKIKVIITEVRVTDRVERERRKGESLVRCTKSQKSQTVANGHKRPKWSQTVSKGRK